VLRGRIGAYGKAHASPDDDPLASAAPPQGGFASTRRGMRLEEALNIAGMDITPGRFVLASVGATTLFSFVMLALLGNALLFVASLVASPFAARAFLRWRMARQRRAFEDQLSESIQAVASAMRTGHSFVGALSQLVEGAPVPTGPEFRRVIADERLGVPLDVALASMVQRMQSRDLQQVALVSVIQRETGGNAAEALERVAGNVRSRDDIRRLVRALTAQGRMAQWVLTALPVVTLFVLKTVNGSQMDPLFKTGYGHALLLLSALMVAVGGMWIGRIVKIKV
jgi:tight adherence protein B